MLIKKYVVAVCCLLMMGSSQQVSAQMKLFPYGLQLFTNMEQVEYCVPIPLDDYKPNSSTERAKQVFINKKNKKYQLSLQGFFRSDTAVNIDTYFKNTYTQKDEEEGKIIEEKEIVRGSNLFYAMGYWNNMINEARFIEITWLRKDDMVKLVVSYPLKEKDLWEKRLETIATYDSFCK